MADIKWSQFTSGGNVQVGDISVGLRSADNIQFTFPGTGIGDANGNLMLGYTSPGVGAINHVLIENAVTTTPPSISAAGTDTNIDLKLSSKGASNIHLNNVLVDNTGDISGIATAMFSGSSSGQAILKAQAAAGTPTLQLPNTSGTLALTSALPSFPITLAQGGTGASLTASNGGIFYSNASTGQILAGTATANQVLLSGASTMPSWSMATYPATTAANKILYSSATNTVSELASANSASLVTNSSGVPSWAGPLNDGQVIIGATGGTPQAANLSQGPGITINTAAHNITISAATGGGGLAWSTISGTTQTGVAGAAYIPTNGALTTIDLPATCNPGDMIAVQGQGSGMWTIQANTGQTIHIGSSASSVAGTVSAANQYDAITLVCIVADTDWAMYGPVSSGFVIV